MKFKKMSKQDTQPDKSSDKDTIPKRSSFRENIEAILIAIVLALFIRMFIVQAFKIPSASMEDTLLIGDHILVNKFIYGVKIPFFGTTIIPFKDPKCGDIIVFKYPEDPEKDFIKRVIGTEGDIVAIRNKQVYINGKPLTLGIEVYKGFGRIQNRGDNFGPKTVPKDSLFVMGDNRNNSHDSRFWGFVDLQDVKGKAFIIYWSWNKDNSGSFINYVRWNRFGHLLK